MIYDNYPVVLLYGYRVVFFVYTANKKINDMKVHKTRKNDAQLIESAICGFILGKVRTSELAAMLRENGLRMVYRSRAKLVIISDDAPNEITACDLLIAKSHGYEFWFVCDGIDVVINIRGLLEEAAKIMYDYNAGAIDFQEKIDRLSRIAMRESEIEQLISKYFKN